MLWSFAQPIASNPRKQSGILASTLQMVQQRPITVLRVFLVFSLWSLLNTTMAHAAPEWQKMTTNLTDTDLRAIAINPSAPSSIYAGSATALYQSTNEGKDFKAVLTPTGGEKAIRQIYISPKDPTRVYAATEAGLFESANSGQTWQRIYSSSNKNEQSALSIIEDNEILFLGTKSGLFFKSVFEATWRRMETDLNHDPVYYSAADEGFLYFATDEKLFRFDKAAKKLKIIFTVGLGRSSEPILENEDGLPADEQNRSVNFLGVNSSLNIIFLAARTGIYLSKDQGQKWERLEAASVPVEHLTSLKILSHGCPEGSSSCFSLLAATTKGAFLYANGRWQAVYQGMETNNIRSVALDSQENIYAATNRGLFLLALEKALPSGLTSSELNRDYKTLSEYFADEPTVREVHNLAVDYAEVNPNKILDWRESAKKSAWLPSLSLGIDENRNWDTSDNFSTGTSTIPKDRVGPDDKSFGHDLNWDVSLAWDFSELIWNPDQTSIDSRSKLMVELREDILDQITRLYFERRRAQMELVNLASLDAPTRFDKEMRVEELTALIDAYTGGRFSEEIARRKALKENIQDKQPQTLNQTRSPSMSLRTFNPTAIGGGGK